MEVGAVEQGAAGDPVGDVPRARESAPGLPRRTDPDDRLVRKPLLGREGGANVEIYRGGTLTGGAAGGGEYGGAEGGYVYQELCELPPDFDGWHPVIGAWVVGNSAAGMGIRESRSLITDNQSKFQPHYMWTSSPDQETIAAWLREK